MSTEILIKESVSEHSDNNFYPSSAIIVFTCSLFLTVTLVILLCCRLKMIRRRLRKGGKSTYAHDADFLVNGMYL
ncbi:low-density lipoprotein receptor-related protein 11-like [Diaphorina citri]|uniref:Low-density lipoprotein receptor-related protein 11-like n=1 Tax=Diaphorina citri TaxID=121845 RepID=A0A1S4EKQ1_DIACI|nr:low-density lipoprotein receptor-related protein 11-like [Diaphorina citri]